MIINEEALKELIREVVIDVVRQEGRNMPKVEPRDDGPEILTLKTAADFLGLSRATLYRYTSTASIPHYKMGKFVRFKRSDLIEWLSAFRVKTMDEIEREAMRYVRSKK